MAARGQLQIPTVFVRLDNTVAYRGGFMFTASQGRVMPIQPLEHSIRLAGGVTCSRTMLPLRPAYAITVHKAQGMTAEEVLVLDSTWYQRGQLYVALSRARELGQLFLERPLTLNDFNGSTAGYTRNNRRSSHQVGSEHVEATYNLLRALQPEATWRQRWEDLPYGEAQQRDEADISSDVEYEEELPHAQEGTDDDTHDEDQQVQQAEDEADLAGAT